MFPENKDSRIMDDWYRNCREVCEILEFSCRVRVGAISKVGSTLTKALYTGPLLLLILESVWERRGYYQFHGLITSKYKRSGYSSLRSSCWICQQRTRLKRSIMPQTSHMIRHDFVDSIALPPIAIPLGSNFLSRGTELLEIYGEPSDVLTQVVMAKWQHAPSRMATLMDVGFSASRCGLRHIFGLHQR
nr:hypothetical protein CFP56_08023 [Quercus suber]